MYSKDGKDFTTIQVSQALQFSYLVSELRLKSLIIHCDSCGP